MRDHFGKAVLLASLIFLWLPGEAPGQVPAPSSPVAGNRMARTEQKASETFWQKLLRIAGISATPSALKAPEEGVERGEVWLSDLTKGAARKLTTGSGYRSPVFAPDNQSVVAIRAARIVRVARASGETTDMYSAKGISKLVGFSRDDPDKLLIMTEDEEGSSSVGLLSLQGGQIVKIPYDPDSVNDRRLLEHVKSWDRVYGNTALYVQQQAERTLSGSTHWTDVYLQKGMQKPVNVSHCNLVNCGQPSLSRDERLVVFIKAVEE